MNKERERKKGLKDKKDEKGNAKEPRGEETTLTLYIYIYSELHRTGWNENHS